MSITNKLKEQYIKANRMSKLAFIERPFIGSPAGPAMAKTNVSNIWAHMNAGYLLGYEYTRWWHELIALRKTAIIGDWSWLNKTIVRGPDASGFMNYATVKDLSKQKAGHVWYTPMVNADGKVAVEGLTFKVSENEFIFTQADGMKWLTHLQSLKNIDVEIEDVTPDYTCYALQGPRSTEILEAVTGEDFRDLRFSTWRISKACGVDVIISRTGITGEVGYEFLIRTDTGKGYALWETIREAGKKVLIREMGFKAQLVPHIETGIATVIKDFMPARVDPDGLYKFAMHWITEEELAAVDWNLSEQFCTPAELGWAHTVDFDGHDFHGRAALVKETERGGPERRLVGLLWDSDDMAYLFAAQFRDEPAPPPPDLPWGQFRILYLKIQRQQEHVGWATSPTYSPNLRRMISLGRIRKDLVEPGTEVVVLWGGFSTEPQCRIRAKVVKLPFIKQNRTMDLTVG